MVLVEVIKLVVNVDWSLNLACEGIEFNLAHLSVLLSLNVIFTVDVISLLEFSDLIAHDIQHNTDGQEDHTKDTKSEHGAHGSWNWSPSRQGLLLELRLL